ncbi:2-amino-3,7-dideoxy-D-threo-hept-6-ulosonate synthase [Actinoplanes sp. NPDC051411]|uniref:2-amino-3,7-dideoxy-D-threo-hept-6-ulosonate synthase n=1 Tax=Actinoplanes sp. NPDC051411 TaxID=3155522 RepID=UPI0034310272
MLGNESGGRRRRLGRLYRHDPARLLVVPLDHAMASGPIGTDLDDLAGRLASGGADAVVLHKGALRHIAAHRFRDLALVLHLNASTGLAPDPDAKYPVATVEEALRLGADAVSVHVNLGSATEDRQVAHLAAVAGDCDRWGVPLLAMMYARGPAIADPRSPAVVAHAVTVAAELGADLVKTPLPDDEAAVVRITAGCPVPVLAAGGEAGRPDAVLAALAGSLRAGAGGVAAGRLIFTAPDPAAAIRHLATLVHGRTPAVIR